MVRLAFAVVSSLVLASLASAAPGGQPYRDPEGRFVVTVPAGWALAKPEGQGEIALMMASSTDEKVKGGACFIAVRDLPQTRDAKQSDLDEAFGQVLTTDFWKAVFAESGIKDAKIERSGNRVQRGRKVFFVVATVAATDAGGAAELATGRQEVHPVPGSLQFVQCVAAKSVYSQMEPAFTGIFASFEPKANQLLVNAAPKLAPSVITLHADATSGGVVKVLAQDTANVPALGVTAGVAVASQGKWEICEGLNYSGKCRIAGPGQADHAAPIGSVRRYLGGKPDFSGIGDLVGKATIDRFKAEKVTNP